MPSRCATWAFWKTTTFTGALLLTGMTAPFVYDGAMNGNVFLAYVEQVLLPIHQTGDVVVMDTSQLTRQPVRATQSSALALRSCSFNPIVPTSPHRKRILETEGHIAGQGLRGRSMPCRT